MRLKRIIPEWKRPKASERELSSSLKSAVSDLIKEAKASLKEVDLSDAYRYDSEETDEDRSIRADGILDDLQGVFAHLKAVANSRLAGPIASLPRIFSRVSLFNDSQWRRVIKISTGFNFPASRDRESTGLGINAYREEPWLDGMQSVWVSNASDLIKSLPDGMESQIKQLVKNSVINGGSASNLADQIEKIFNTTRYRAELIAIDQIQKANAALTEQRQRDVGVTGYVWRGVEDGRERVAHKLREGKHFDWNSPPPDGHPGQPVRCRCWAEPDFSGTLFDIGE